MKIRLVQYHHSLCSLFNLSHPSSLLNTSTKNKMDSWNNTTTNLFLSQQVAYPPHLFVEEIPNMGNSSGIKSVTKEPRGSQLTIFYGGQVIVFDDIQPHKANDIMSFATKGSMSQNQKLPATSSRPFPFLMNPIPTTANNSVQDHPQAPSKPVISDLPLARKASLHRFLEKRKDRIAARAPYQTSNPMATLNKTAESMSWLALAPKSPQDESETSSSYVLF